MNTNLENKVKEIYKECKELLTKHEFADVLSNVDFTTKEVWNEFASQINYTNKILAKQKDLYFILTILTEAKNGLTSGTPSNDKVIKQIDGWIKQIDMLLKSYSAVIIGQRWILDYYNKGGGLY